MFLLGFWWFGRGSFGWSEKWKRLVILSIRQVILGIEMFWWAMWDGMILICPIWSEQPVGLVLRLIFDEVHVVRWIVGLYGDFGWIYKASVWFKLNFVMGPFGKVQVECFKVRFFRNFGHLEKIWRDGVKDANVEKVEHRSWQLRFGGNGMGNGGLGFFEARWPLEHNRYKILVMLGQAFGLFGWWLGIWHFGLCGWN